MKVAPYYKEGNEIRLMLVGQDPTIRRNPERVKYVLMLDQPTGQLSRWLKGIFGAHHFQELTLYATNLVKCSFDKLPTTDERGASKFLQPYFQQCQGYLIEELRKFQPTILITLGEPAHEYFLTILDNGNDIGKSMKEAFTGSFFRARFRELEFDYSPCLHIQTFRVAETYGEKVSQFKKNLIRYFER